MPNTNSVVNERSSGTTSTVHYIPQETRRTPIRNRNPITNGTLRLPLVELARYPITTLVDYDYLITRKINADFSYVFQRTDYDCLRQPTTYNLYSRDPYTPQNQNHINTYIHSSTRLIDLWHSKLYRGRDPRRRSLGLEDYIGYIDKSTIAITVDGSKRVDSSYGPVMGAGIFFGPNSKHNDSLPLSKSHPQTSQRAEILAAIAAVKKVIELVKLDDLDEDIQVEKVYLITDSKVVADAMNGLIKKWLRNGWRKPGGHLIQYRPDYEYLIEMVDFLREKYGIEIAFRHVHREWNFEADELAREGSEAARHYEHTSARSCLNVHPVIPGHPTSPVQTISNSDHTRESLSDAMSRLALASHKINTVFATPPLRIVPGQCESSILVTPHWT